MRKLFISILSSFLLVSMVAIKPIIAEDEANEPAPVQEQVSNQEEEVLIPEEEEVPLEEVPAVGLPIFDIKDYIDVEFDEANFEANEEKTAFSVTYDGSEKNPFESIALNADGEEFLRDFECSYKIEKDSVEVTEAKEAGVYTITPIVTVIHKPDVTNTPIERILDSITLTINKVEGTPVYEVSRVYDGTEFKPSISIESTTLDPSTYTLENTRLHLTDIAVASPIEPGVYESEVVWSDEFLANSVVGEEFLNDLGDGKVGYSITYYIERIEVVFAGWDILPGETITATMLGETAVFEWVEDDNGNIAILYNGYSPMMMLDADNDFALPNAKFVRADNGEPVEDIVRGLNGDYICSSDISDELILLATRNAGEHTLIFAFLPTSHYKTSSQASYTILPREIDVEFTNTAVSIDADDKRPSCEYYVYDADGIRSELPGLVGMDDYLMYKVGFEYYDMDGNRLARQPQEEGQYRAKVAYLTLSDGVLPNNNYVIKNVGAEVNYVIGKNPQKVIGENVSVVSMNSSSLSGAKVVAPTSAQIKNIIEKGNAPEAIKEAYKAGEHINLYIKVSEVEAERLGDLNLPANNAVTVDVQLYACIDSDEECTKYEITETSSNVSFNLTFTEEQMEQIGYSEDRNCYFGRYHGNNTNADFYKLIVPYKTGTEEAPTYTFVLSSDKFSEFTFYTKEKPSIDKEIINKRIVPNTQA